MLPEHSIYMSRCLQLARLGEGHTSPNPMVGSVIVYDEKIIGEGFHQQFGGPHAEVNAINSVKEAHLLKKSTIYVSLEPCSHHGKTPPCADLIIEKGIPRVVIGTLDPNPLVAGKGMQKLREAGCEVIIGILNEECRELNRRFFTFQECHRPYIILKWAQTADGFVDAIRSEKEQGMPNWITDELARVSVHKQRSTENAILIGTSTAERDNPSLTLRDWYGKQAIRIVFDINNRLPSSLKIFDNKASTYIISSGEYSELRAVKYISLSGENIIEQLLQYLYNIKVESLIVEGGPFTLQRFIDRGYWDEAHVYTGSMNFGEGVKAPCLNCAALFEESFNNSRLCVYRKK